jgi:hypothetical protein
MGRIGRSFQIVGQSYRILMQDKELMALPLISGAIMAAVVLSFAFGFGLDRSRFERHGPDVYLPVFLMYVVTYAVGIFFQAAVVAGATERMRGGDPTVGSALAAAGRRIGPILMWAVVAATVGMALRAIQDRVAFVGGGAAICAWVTLVAIVGLLAYVIGVMAVVVFAVGAIGLMIFFSALQGVYLASLYRYTTEGVPPPGFDKALLNHAFVPKGR